MVMESGNEMMNVCKDTQLEAMMRPVGRTKYHDCDVGSVVGVERQSVYPHHCSSVHTPLVRPTNITEKGCGFGLSNWVACYRGNRENVCDELDGTDI